MLRKPSHGTSSAPSSDVLGNLWSFTKYYGEIVAEIHNKLLSLSLCYSHAPPPYSHMHPSTTAQKPGWGMEDHSQSFRHFTAAGVLLKSVFDPKTGLVSKVFPSLFQSFK